MQEDHETIVRNESPLGMNLHREIEICETIARKGEKIMQRQYHSSSNAFQQMCLSHITTPSIQRPVPV